jgi:hypothetical protein
MREALIGNELDLTEANDRFSDNATSLLSFLQMLL